MANETRSANVMVRITPSLKEAAEKAAQDDTRSLSSLIEKLLTDYLKAKEYLKTAEDVHADLTAKIETLKDNLPHVDETAAPSPKKAMAQLDRAHGKNEIAKAKGKKAKLASKPR